MKRYDDCMRTDGMCGMCSLVSRGSDCHGNRIVGVMYQRTAMGMTQQILADKTGIGIRLIQKYESGSCSIGNMTLTNAMALAEVLECDVRDLL